MTKKPTKKKLPAKVTPATTAEVAALLMPDAPQDVAEATVPVVDAAVPMQEAPAGPLPIEKTMVNGVWAPSIAELRERIRRHGRWIVEPNHPEAQRAYLQGAYLQGAYLQGAYLQGADLQRAYLQGAYLQGAYLQGADLQGADLQRAYLQGAYLQGAYLQGADLQGADLQGADLQRAYLQGADLQGADLQGADLQRAYLQGAYLQGAYLQGADLQRAYLQGAYLQGADLQGADLQRAYLQGAYLQGADLQGADLQGAAIEDGQIAKMDFAVCPSDGSFTAFKKVWMNYNACNPSAVVLRLEIPADAARTSNLKNRKCRSAAALVVAVEDLEGNPIAEPGPLVGYHQKQFTYTVGALAQVDDFDPDPREDCTKGIHWFITRREAQVY
jgi:uncharacterized protein YjbI with pentapeptide repeats